MAIKSTEMREGLWDPSNKKNLNKRYDGSTLCEKIPMLACYFVQVSEL